jgi:HAD superfamily hydrolase (TIGR01509 family)
VFDVDGTLADTEETHRQAFNYAFVRLGLKWEWTKSRYRELLAVSGGHERIGHYIDTLFLSDDDKTRLPVLVPAIHQTKTQLYLELIGDGRCPLRPGVARLLSEASDAGVQLAIASTTTAANVDALLRSHLDDLGCYRFAVIACADCVERKKPAPDIYRLVLSMLGRSCAECVVFEDSPNGLRAAQAAGLFTVVTPSSWNEHDDFRAADILLPHLGDVDHRLPSAQADQMGGPWLTLEALASRHAAASKPPSARRA